MSRQHFDLQPSESITSGNTLLTTLRMKLMLLKLSGEAQQLLSGPCSVAASLKVSVSTKDHKNRPMLSNLISSLGIKQILHSHVSLRGNSNSYPWLFPSSFSHFSQFTWHKGYWLQVLFCHAQKPESAKPSQRGRHHVRIQLKFLRMSLCERPPPTRATLGSDADGKYKNHKAVSGSFRLDILTI